MEYVVGVLAFLAAGGIGAALAFWYRSKYMTVRGEAALLVYRLDIEEREHKKTIAAALAAAEAFEDDERRDEELISGLKKRLADAEARSVRSATDEQLLALGNELFMAKAKAQGGGADGGGVSGPSGTRLRSVSGEIRSGD